jgi:hypothetical protein
MKALTLNCFFVGLLRIAHFLDYPDHFSLLISNSCHLHAQRCLVLDTFWLCLLCLAIEAAMLLRDCCRALKKPK